MAVPYIPASVPPAGKAYSLWCLRNRIVWPAGNYIVWLVLLVSRQIKRHFMNAQPVNPHARQSLRRITRALPIEIAACNKR